MPPMLSPIQPREEIHIVPSSFSTLNLHSGAFGARERIRIRYLLARGGGGDRIGGDRIGGDRSGGGDPIVAAFDEAPAFRTSRCSKGVNMAQICMPTWHQTDPL